MAPSSKAKAAGVSASSFLDLKAELAKQETDFSKKKAGGSQSYVAGNRQRPDKASISFHLHDIGYTNVPSYYFRNLRYGPALTKVFVNAICVILMQRWQASTQLSLCGPRWNERQRCTTS